MILAVIKKEFIHIIRDPQSLILTLVMPLMMLFLYSYAMNLEMREIKMVIIDQSKTIQSQQLINKIKGSGFFLLQYQDLKLNQIESIFQKRKAQSILIIPSHFVKDLEIKRSTDLQLLIDASDPNAANYIQQYVLKIVASYPSSNKNKGLFQIQPRFYYNPDLKSAYFFVPGIIAIILLLISTLLTSMAIAREKEQQTLEQLLVSPIHPIQMILGKIIPYTFLGLVDGLLILLVGILYFKVPFVGSALLLLLMMLIYVTCGMMLGLLISTIAKTQQVAMITAMLITILPTILLSGFMFPINSMPLIFRLLSKIVPATHFIQIIRGIVLKGAGLENFTTQISYLLGFILVLLIVSIKKFNIKLR